MRLKRIKYHTGEGDAKNKIGHFRLCPSVHNVLPAAIVSHAHIHEQDRLRGQHF